MRFYSARVAAASISICLLSCLYSLAASPDAPLYPLELGAKWIYEAGDLQFEEEVTGFDVIDGERCIKLETRMQGKTVASEHLAVREDGVYRVTVAGERVNPPLCFLKFPAAKVTKWQVDSKISNVNIAGQFVLGKTTLRVPAGEFHAVTVRGTKFQSEAGPLEFTYYFAPGVGKVKQIVSVNGKSAELSLKEFVPPRIEKQTPSDPQ